MGIQKLLIGIAFLAALVIMVLGVISLNQISERLRAVENRIEARGAGIQDELHILSGDTENIMPNRGSLLDIEERLKAADLRAFLEERVNGELRHHHEFRVSVADCPNACSQPQIRDVGIIGACEPAVGEAPCSLCRKCLEVCGEDALSLAETAERPAVDRDRCVKCGQCIRVCPTGTLVAGRSGYRVLLGGKLGRHPRLARELGGLHSEAEVLDILDRCIAFYKAHSEHGERFSDLYRDAKDLGLGTES